MPDARGQGTPEAGRCAARVHGVPPDPREVEAREAEVREAEVREADVREADLREADLRGLAGRLEGRRGRRCRW